MYEYIYTYVSLYRENVYGVFLPLVVVDDETGNPFYSNWQLRYYSVSQFRLVKKIGSVIYVIFSNLVDKVDVVETVVKEV